LYYTSIKTKSKLQSIVILKMDWLDGIIIIVLAAAIIRGFDAGIVRQLFSATGFISGLFLGAWIESKLIHVSHTTASRAWLSVLVIVGCGLVLLTIAELAAHALKSKIQLTRLDKVDRELGSLVASLAILATVWLGSSIFTNTPFPTLQQQIRDSAIINELNSVMPPAPNVIAKVGHVITSNGFPQVFTGHEPEPSESTVATPDMGKLTSAVEKTKKSVVKIEGVGCGGIVEGSGFVAGDGLVVTNAHVVAGVASPKVIDGNGTHKTTVIWFDADLDLAVLRALDLYGNPLPLVDKTLDAGTQAVVLGYPGGGAFKADPAAIIDAFTATGRNIYNQETATREIYSMKADVISGNSGGPLVDKEGQVIGVVFAHSVAYQHVGYALTMPQVIDELGQAKENIEPVGTGSCAQ
jgi:S1-C subfamily serine protease